MFKLCFSRQVGLRSVKCSKYLKNSKYWTQDPCCAIVSSRTWSPPSFRKQEGAFCWLYYLIRSEGIIASVVINTETGPFLVSLASAAFLASLSSVPSILDSVVMWDFYSYRERLFSLPLSQLKPDSSTVSQVAPSQVAASQSEQVSCLIEVFFCSVVLSLQWAPLEMLLSSATRLPSAQALAGVAENEFNVYALLLSCYDYSKGKENDSRLAQASYRYIMLISLSPLGGEAQMTPCPASEALVKSSNFYGAWCMRFFLKLLSQVCENDISQDYTLCSFTNRYVAPSEPVRGPCGYGSTLFPVLTYSFCLSTKADIAALRTTPSRAMTRQVQETFRSFNGLKMLLTLMETPAPVGTAPEVLNCVQGNDCPKVLKVYIKLVNLVNLISVHDLSDQNVKSRVHTDGSIAADGSLPMARALPHACASFRKPAVQNVLDSLMCFNPHSIAAYGKFSYVCCSHFQHKRKWHLVQTLLEHEMIIAYVAYQFSRLRFYFLCLSLWNLHGLYTTLIAYFILSSETVWMDFFGLLML